MLGHRIGECLIALARTELLHAQKPAIRKQYEQEQRIPASKQIQKQHAQEQRVPANKRIVETRHNSMAEIWRVPIIPPAKAKPTVFISTLEAVVQKQKKLEKNSSRSALSGVRKPFNN